MIDENLFQRAQAVARAPMERTDLINTALRVFITREAQMRLAAMDGVSPNLAQIPTATLDCADLPVG